MTSSEDTKDAPELLNDAEFEARRLAMRENAKHVLWESGLAEMLRSINKDLLKGRGRFEEYDSMVLFKWGSGYTRRHMWADRELLRTELYKYYTKPVAESSDD